MLHGRPTWGYIWRRFIPLPAVTHRVIVPDHMGFGKSETPRDRAIPPALALADIQGLWPRGPVIQVPGAGHYIQEDAPEITVSLV